MSRALPALLALLLTGIGPASMAADVAAAGKAATVDATAGTTIVGEQDSAMGLYLLPWKDETASGMELAPALLDVPPTPLDDAQLQRVTDYREAAASYRRSHSQYSR